MPLPPALVELFQHGNPLVLGLLTGAVVPLVMMRFIARRLAWAFFVVMISLALVVFGVLLLPHELSLLQRTVGVTSGLSMVWSVFGMLVGRTDAPRYRRGPSHATHLACLQGAFHLGALCAGAVAAVGLVYALTVRGVYSILELVFGGPLPHEAFKFGADGLIMIAALMVAGLVGLRATGQRLLITVLLWLLVLGVFWLSFLWPLYFRLDDGTYARTAVVLVSIVGLSSVLSGFVLVQAIRRNRWRWRAARANPDALLEEYEDWPGLHQSSGAIGIMLVLLVCFQYVAPPTAGPIGNSLSAIITAVCLGAAGAGAFSLVGRRWSVNLAETAMGLMTLSVAGVAVAFLPCQPAALGARFPIIFNALMFSMALMSWFWVWIARVWRQQIGDQTAWTTAGRLVPVCENFSFFVACFALVLGSLMAIWPRLRPIATPDDSLGRVAAAVAAHLALLLALLWNGRVVRRSSFKALTILAVLSLVGFIVVRAGPFRSTVVIESTVGEMAHASACLVT